MGDYFGWVEVSGALFWVGEGEWGEWEWVHCLIMPSIDQQFWSIMQACFDTWMLLVFRYCR